MGKKLNKEEVQSRLEKRGLKLVSNYTKLTDVHVLICKCGEEFSTPLVNIFSFDKKSCLKCSKYQFGWTASVTSSKLAELTNKIILVEDSFINYDSIATFMCVECKFQFQRTVSTLFKTFRKNRYNSDSVLSRICCCETNNMFGKQFGELTIISSEKISKNNRIYYKCQCSCGTITYIAGTVLVHGKSLKCNKHEFNQNLKYIRESLEIQNVPINYINKYKVSMTCHCKKEFILNRYHLTKKIRQKETIQCIGCLCSSTTCKNTKIITRGKITINLAKTKRGILNKVFVAAKCKCGNDKKYVSLADFNAGKIKTCGHCSVWRNGVKTSHIALELNKQLGRGVHNYKTRNKNCIDIAFVYRGKKIAIEYDEWKWHKKKKQQDYLKSKKLIQDGWIVIRILAHRDIPSNKKVFTVIHNAIKNNKKIKILKSKNWNGYD